MYHYLNRLYDEKIALYVGRTVFRYVYILIISIKSRYTSAQLKML